ncbi:Cytosol aminopeptidase [Anaerohalosphaera lusitana]|uniref:Probable cytosol aminopeptidase n=1 Tax=Anaerohalosphaera lusitana TaxID=1936003 RepID=A0A1U9NJ48_9BACT|nr:leucyl aminopeptidase [Anaerohalosphaera lusitana]AQT67758.1 Cytosol aminopeptidase [Anaerohalosphaera lusitana]
MPKRAIDISVKTRKADPSQIKADILAVGIFSDSKKPAGLAKDIDKQLNGEIGNLLGMEDFTGGFGKTAVLYTNGRITAPRVLLVGLGEKKELASCKLRKAAAHAADKAVNLKARTLALAIHQDLPAKFDLTDVGQTLTEGIYMGGYRYDEFVSKKDSRLNKLNVLLTDADQSAARKLGKGAKAGNIIGQAQSFARTIANRPGNIINPKTLASTARKMASDIPGLTCTVITEKQLKQKKAGGILAVGGGSATKPCMIVLKYSPTGKTKSKRNIALVGKAVTFDAGGISLKPSAGMHDMKFDKGGGMCVLGAMQAISKLKPAATVYGIIPAAENMPSGTSYRPGDIVTTMSGKTVEIQNTDAEGRMILADAIHHATQLKCDTIVDVATLTGACVVALGKHMAGLMSSDDKLIDQLKQAADKSGERVWHLPSGPEYLEQMKSKIADLKNTGGKGGGACTAAAFLKEFAGDAKWAHIDIAGVEIFTDGSKIGSPGSPGFGVRLLTEYVTNA